MTNCGNYGILLLDCSHHQKTENLVHQDGFNEPLFYIVHDTTSFGPIRIIKIHIHVSTQKSIVTVFIPLSALATY